MLNLAEGITRSSASSKASSGLLGLLSSLISSKLLLKSLGSSRGVSNSTESESILNNNLVYQEIEKFHNLHS